MIDHLRRNGADAINLFVVPFLIALLPWKLGFGVLKRMAARGCPRIDSADSAWRAARAHGQSDETEWTRRYRLLVLLERVDTWLILLRSARWWRRQTTQSGEWPSAPGGSLLLTYHWGGGNWVWSNLRERGIAAQFLARPVEARDLGSGRVALWYGTVRQFGMRRTGGFAPLFTGGSTDEIKRAWAANRSMVGMLDLPALAHQKTISRPLLDGVVALPYGLARLAATAGIRVAVFSCTFDIESGRRELRIETLPAGCDAEAIATHYVQHLDRCLREESAFWQMWSAAPLMFAAAKSNLAETTS